MSNSKGRRSKFRKRLAIRRPAEKKIMNRNYNRDNDGRVVNSENDSRDVNSRNDSRDVNSRNDSRGFSYSQNAVVIVNEEFAKNATPAVTQAAILARLNGAANPVSADLNSASVNG